MRVRSWNAYASNNSGSYTIVGALPSEDAAREVATLIRAVVEAHTAWCDEQGVEDGSPLEEFCREQGLDWSNGAGLGWPEHSRDNRPQVAVVGKQVIVHHEYTVTLPRVFGELFYRKGGRVQHEENHAHDPIGVIATFWWGWSAEDRAREREAIPRLIHALTVADGVLVGSVPHRTPAAWKAADGFGELPLTIGAVFRELIPSVEALRTVGEAHGARVQVRLHEIESLTHDPFLHLRPSNPAVPRFDVILREVGPRRDVVEIALFDTLGLYTNEISDILANLPSTLAISLAAPLAQAVTDALRGAGAVVEQARNDG